MDTDPVHHPFAYLADPVFIISVLLYTLNRFVFKPHHIGGWFTHGYLNDVLCLPIFVPVTLYAVRVLGVRRGHAAPRAWEIVVCFLAFVAVFQIVTPRFPRVFITAGDPLDVIAYAAGGMVAHRFWTGRHPPKRTR